VCRSRGLDGMLSSCEDYGGKTRCCGKEPGESFLPEGDLLRDIEGVSF